MLHIQQVQLFSLFYWGENQVLSDVSIPRPSLFLQSNQTLYEEAHNM
jgi:hypothetical protein